MDPMARFLVAMLFGTHAAETILASVHVRAHQQAGQYGYFGNDGFVPAQATQIFYGA